MSIWRIDSLVFPECGEYIKGRGYYNSNTGKYVSRKYEWMGNSVPKKYVRYEFKCYDDYEVLERFGVKYIDRVSRFLSLIYRKSLNSIEGSSDVYVSHVEIAGLLGEGSYKDILSSLINIGVIVQSGGYRMKYDANKFVKIFRLNNDFYKCEKRIRYIRNRQLYGYLEKKNTLDYECKDVYQRYELSVLRSIDVVEFDIETIVDLRVRRKVGEDLDDFLNMEYLTKKRESTNLLKRLNDKRNGWNEIYLKNYKERLKKLCVYFLESIDSVKSGDITDYVYADNFSGRIYNPVNNRFKEMRRALRIDGEKLVEIDLKNSYISLLYLLFLVINDEVDLGKGGKDIKKRLGSISSGKQFLNEYRECFVDKRSDFYTKVAGKFNVSSRNDDGRVRRYLKRTVLSLLNTRKSFEDGKVFYGKSYEHFMRRVFCDDGYEFLEYIKNNDIFEMYYEKNVWKGFLSYKNVPKLLMRMEVIVMKIVFDRLINDEVKYISLFDGFLCKESDVNRVINIISDEIERFKCLEFKTK